MKSLYEFKSNIQQKGRIILLFAFNLFFISINAQNQELKNSFEKINSLFREYRITSMLSDYRVVFKNVKMTYKHPNMIISYDTRLAPGYSALPSTKLGKNSITIPIRGTTIRLDYNQVQIFNHSDGIEIMECGQKNLEGLWTILTKDGILSKKIYNELCQFQNLVTSSGFMGNLGTTNSTSSSVNSANKYNRKVIKLKRQTSNVYTIPCKVNGLSLNFIFDTGASAISISKSEAIFMLKNGYLSVNDIIGNQQFQTASGDIQVGTKIIIKKIEIGGLILQNVEASVVHNENAPLLLGQSALSKLGKIEIDYNNSTLTIIRDR